MVGKSWTSTSLRARRHRVLPVLTKLVSCYDMISFYTIHRVGPSLTARPETLIHGREGRVNTGWPSSLSGKVFFCDTIIECRVGPLAAAVSQGDLGERLVHHAIWDHAKQRKDRSPSRLLRYGHSKCLWRRCLDFPTTARARSTSDVS